MRVDRRIALVVLGGAVAFGLPAALHAQPQSTHVIDDVVQFYDTASGQWLGTLAPITQRLFGSLAAVELALSGAWWALHRETADAIVAAAMKKFLFLTFAYSLITLFPQWIPLVLQGFRSAAQQASGLQATNPSQVFSAGVAIAGRMLDSFSLIGFLDSNPGILIAALCAFVVVLAFSAITIQIVVTLVESYFVLSGGILFLGFAAFRGTVAFAEGYLAYAFSVAIRVYLLYLLTGVGMALSRQWATLDFSASLTHHPSLQPHFEVLCASLLFAFLVWRVPYAVASRLSQHAHFRLGEALR